MTEHWLHQNEIKTLHLDNYKIISTSCREKGYGGSAIYVKTDLVSNELIDVKQFNIEKIFECSGVKVNMNKVDYYIICIYRSPNSDIKEFLTRLNECLDFLQHKFKLKHYIVCGDFNIDYLSNSKDRSELLDILNSFSLTVTCNEPTRITPFSETVIDYVCTNIIGYHCISVENGLSDHNGQVLCIPNKNKLPKTQFKRRFYSKQNFANINSHLCKEKWEDVYNLDTTNVNKQFETFNNILQHYINISFPLVNCSYDSANKKTKSWVTTGIRKSSANLKNMSYLTKKGIVNVNHYKAYKNIYKKVIRAAKRKYNDEQLFNANNKSKAMWNIIKCNLAQKENKNNLISCLNVDNVIISDPIDIADSFIKYFINIPETITKNLPSQTDIATPVTQVNNVMFLKPVTRLEITEIINSLKNTTSSGPDEVTTLLIKECKLNIAEILAYIINNSFRYGTFPELLKLSKIIPIYKKGENTLLDNYRPITLLSIFSKIFEKAMLNRLLSFLNKYKLMSDKQHGFTKGKSTISALVEFISEIYKNLDKGNNILATYIDLSKAFDCVNHNILLSKLEKLGVMGICNQWFKSYLLGRKQFVVCNGKKSQTMRNNYGVPQGSILGPVLFIIFIRDLDQNIPGFMVKYADDISLITNSNDYTALVNEVNTKLNNIFSYLCKNKLIMNENKTVNMSFHASHTKSQQSAFVKVNNKLIRQTTQFKLLGVVLDESLKWDHHIEILSSKLASVCYALKQMKEICSFDILKIYYHSNFESIMTYGIILWGKSPEAERIFRLQKRAIRCMLGMNLRDSCREKFKSLKILTLPSLYIYSILNFVKLNLANFTQHNSNHDYDTRGNNNLQYDIHRLELYKMNPYYQGALLYNKLPNHIKECCSITHFKNHLKNYLIENCFYTVNEFLNM